MKKNFLLAPVRKHKGKEGGHQWRALWERVLMTLSSFKPDLFCKDVSANQSACPEMTSFHHHWDNDTKVVVGNHQRFIWSEAFLSALSDEDPESCPSPRFPLICLQPPNPPSPPNPPNPPNLSSAPKARWCLAARVVRGQTPSSLTARVSQDSYVIDGDETWMTLDRNSFKDDLRTDGREEELFQYSLFCTKEQLIFL